MIKTPPFQIGPERIVYRNPWTEVVEQDLTYADGCEGLYAYVRKQDGAAVLPLHADGTVTLLSVYRVPLKAWSVECPVGGIEPGEKPAEAAHRELAEEAGLIAQRLSTLGSVHNATGITNTRTHLFLAEKLHETITAHEPGEAIEIVNYPLDVAVGMIDAGKVTQATTIIMLLKCAELISLK